jgi:hypothetical protein
MVMDHLRGFRSLLDAVFLQGTKPRQLRRAVARCLDCIDRLHAIPTDTSGLPQSGLEELFFLRTEASIDVMARRFPWFAEACEVGMQIEVGSSWVGVDSVPSLLADLREKIPEPDYPAVVLHGDPHLGNLMVRQYGQGFSARLIDPNPTWGSGDYLYDSGKLFHFAGASGAARLFSERVNAPVARQRGRWTLPEAQFQPPLSRALLGRQATLQSCLTEWRDRRAGDVYEVPDSPRWHLAVATAHLVTATNIQSDAAARMFLRDGLVHLRHAHERTSR